MQRQANNRTHSQKKDTNVFVAFAHKVVCLISSLHCQLDQLYICIVSIVCTGKLKCIQSGSSRYNSTVF